MTRPAWLVILAASLSSMLATVSWRRVMRAAVLTLAAAGLLAACGGSTDCEPAASDSTLDPDSTLELAGAEGRVVITVEVADTASERCRGLSGRDQLAPDHGMLFVNDRDVSTGFHMEDTKIPLSLAFIDETGTIVGIVDMEPCASAPCEIYEPPAPYRVALEVKQGSLADWNIVAGDRVDLSGEK